MVNKLGAICAVYGCNNYKQQKGEKKSFFRFPKDPNLLKSWIVACKRQDLDLLLKSKDSDYFYKTCVVCSDHFKLECFRNKNLFSQGLLPGSIPTLNLFEVIIPTVFSIKMEITDEADQMKANKIKVEENLNEEFADAVVLDKSTSFPSTSNDINLIEENNRLTQKIKEYRRKAKCNASLLWKYKKQNQLLRKKLLQYRNGAKIFTTNAHSILK